MTVFYLTTRSSASPSYTTSMDATRCGRSCEGDQVRTGTRLVNTCRGALRARSFLGVTSLTIGVDSSGLGRTGRDWTDRGMQNRHVPGFSMELTLRERRILWSSAGVGEDN
jgi:hypothetical protein